MNLVEHRLGKAVGRVCGRAFCGALLAGFFPSPGVALANTAEADAAWKDVLRLDAGPPSVPQGDIKETFSRHVASQERALRRFLEVSTGGGEWSFEARFRLARVLAMRAEILGDNSLQEESDALLDALEKTATQAQQSHIAFTKISQWMRRNRFPGAEKRRELLAAAREFKERYPRDIRSARLLVEVATRFDREPEVKRTILAEAGGLTKDPELTQRIGDEMRKLGLLGRKLEMSFSDVGGRPFKLEQYRGRPLVLLYFSEASLPSLAAWRVLNEVLAAHPAVARVAVSLDESRTALERARQGLGGGWTIGWDGLGWGSPLARRWGINVLPTVWLLDAQGRLASLDGLEETGPQLEALSKRR